ncbi:MAG: hypothetical protein E6G56_04425 [Actinobacteria bacterium]|nr:MAG: hypothetical protein E6G56_04425 [Actinomycetota bacterium]
MPGAFGGSSIAARNWLAPRGSRALCSTSFEQESDGSTLESRVRIPKSRWHSSRRMPGQHIE